MKEAQGVFIATKKEKFVFWIELYSPLMMLFESSPLIFVFP